MKYLFLVLVNLSFCCLAGCHTRSIAVADEGKAQQDPDYVIVSMTTMAFGKDVRVRAVIEELKNSIDAIAGQRPRSRLVITNLSTGKTLHTEECGDSVLSTPGFTIERGPALVMTTKGGSGDGVSVYEVTESEARLVLEEAYRGAVITMPNNELAGDMGFLIVDGENGSSPLAVRRFQYSKEERRFVLAGTASFAQFLKTVNAQFSNRPKPTGQG